MCLAAFALMGIGTPLIGDGVFLGTSTLTHFAPWWSVESVRPLVNTWIGDTIDSQVPQTVLLKESVQAGAVRWWNPFIAGGTPLGAVPHAGLASPMTWPWLVLPTAYAPGAAKLLEIAVAAGGIALLTRRLGLRPEARAVAALVYCSSGFVVAWTNWPHTKVAALVPLLVWAVDRAVVERRARDAVAVALVLASMLLAGFPAVVGYAVYACLAYAVVRLAVLQATRVQWFRAVGVGLSGALLGVGLSAWQLLPFVAQLGTSVDTDGRAQSSAQHLPLLSLATAVLPQSVGDVSDYAESYWLGHLNPVESFSYLGAATLVLVALALVVRPAAHGLRTLRAVAIGGLLITIVLVYVGGAPLTLAQKLPVLADNPIGRVRVLVGFFAALAAGLGCHLLVAPRTTQRPLPARPTLSWASRVARWSGAVVVIGGSVILVVVALAKVPDDALPGLRRPATGALVCAVLALVVVVGARRRRSAWWPTIGAVLVPVLVAVPAVVVARTWWPVSDASTFYPLTATHNFLARNLRTERYVGTSWTMLPGTSSLYSLRAATGHAFHTAQWQAMLEAADPDAMGSRTNSTMSQESLGSPVLDRLAVRYAVANPEAALPGDLRGSASPEIERRTSGRARTPVLSGPVRGIQLLLPQGVDVAEGGDLVVSLRSLDGEVLTATRRPTTATDESFGAWVALAGDHLTDDQQYRITLEVDGAASVVVPSDRAGNWAVGYVIPDDDLTVVHTGDATIYERGTVAPRLRWAGDAVVIDDQDNALAAIVGGLDIGTVVLEDEADARTVPGDAAADVRVVSDTGDVVTVEVDADGDGWLVYSESVRGGGWHATVDGRAVDLVPADVALGAVPVPEGQHVVELRYVPPGLHVGAAISSASLLALLGVGVVGVLRRKARLDDEATVSPAPGGDT